MNLLESIFSSIPQSKLADTKSPVVDFVNKIRRVPINFNGTMSFPRACGLNATMRFQLAGSMMISHAEIAAILGKTVEEVDAMTDIEVEQQAPFLQPAIAKFFSVVDDSGVSWAAQFPTSPWVAPESSSSSSDDE